MTRVQIQWIGGSRQMQPSGLARPLGSVDETGRQTRHLVRHASSSSWQHEAKTVQISDYLTNDDHYEGPRLSSMLPKTSGGHSANDRTNLPVMIYLPGIDGTGLAASKQFPSLMEHFNLVTFVTPPGDRTPYDDLVELLKSYVERVLANNPPSVPVYLLGESFGGILALSLASKCPGLIDRVLLVNPATSFQSSLWPQLAPLLLQVPREAYPLLPIALAPVLGNPLNLLQASIEGMPDDSSIVEQAAALVRGAANLLLQLPFLAELLPPATLAWKFELLTQGCNSVERDIPNVSQRVFILVGDQDLLIPSEREAVRLKNILPRSHVRIERGRSHALLQEGGVNLAKIMEEEGVMVKYRRMSAAHKSRNAKSSGFGLADPIELPTLIELDRSAQRITGIGRRLSSPVFLSTYQDGTMTLGLDALPSPGERPILFVGNHQTLALDMAIMCEEILRERNIMLRGLAHPAIFASREKKSNASGGDMRVDAMPAILNALNGRTNANTNTQGRRGFEGFLTEFGAVPVGPRNFAKLLSNNEAILLYPGGAREAYRKKGEEYKLFWPGKSEFVRMAAKYDAIIVPFAGVGVDDSMDIVLDGEEVQNLPIIGSRIASTASRMPQARRGVNAAETEAESFVSPLALPKIPPNRLYYLFQAPIETSRHDVKDKEKCHEIYESVKESVQNGIDTLLTKREGDPYKEFGPRFLYESARPGSKAPSFSLLDIVVDN
eukprot:jgi/Picsp_1/5388/NSC_02748-R1_protein